MRRLLWSPTLRRRILLVLAAGCLLLGCSNATTDKGADADAGRGRTVSVLAGTATPASEGDCADEVDNAAASPSHVTPGTPMDYTGLPPVSGAHWGQWPDISKPVYEAAERPDLGELVHSQEHGWTMVWYDEQLTSGGSASAAVEAAADAVEAAKPTKVVFVPWTSADGAQLPDGTHVALTHWGAKDNGTEYRQFCRTPSAEAVLAFVGRHPYTDAGEPDGP